MGHKYMDNLKKIVEFGLDHISENETVEIKLKDLMYVYAVLQEFMRFFHQPNHSSSIDAVNKFIGSVAEPSDLKVLHTAVYDKLPNMLPEYLEKMIDDGLFDCPDLPFYFEPKDQEIKQAP